MSNKLMEDIISKASSRKKTIILPESHDDRVIKAAEILSKEKIASIITIGNENKVLTKAKSLGCIISGVRIVDPEKSDKLSDFTNMYFNLRKKKGITIEAARETMKKDLFFAAMMVKESMADGSVAGSTASTGDVLRAGLQCIGMPEGISTVSSFFLMVMPEKTYSFADCAVVPAPDAEQLADIAVITAINHQKLTGEEPFIAMLSFSTKGSAEHESIDKVIQATGIAKKKHPEINIDGELQFDAAIIDSIGRRKAPGSSCSRKSKCINLP